MSFLKFAPLALFVAVPTGVLVNAALDQLRSEAQQLSSIDFPSIEGQLKVTLTDSSGSPWAGDVMGRIMTQNGVIHGEGSLGSDGVHVFVMDIPIDVAFKVDDSGANLLAKISGQLEVWPENALPGTTLENFFVTDPQDGVAAFAKVTLTQSHANPDQYTGSAIAVMSEPPYYGQIQVSDSNSAHVNLSICTFSLAPEEYLSARALDAGHFVSVSTASNIGIYRWDLSGGIHVVASDVNDEVVGVAALRRQGQTSLAVSDHFTLTATVDLSGGNGARWVVIYAQGDPVMPLRNTDSNINRQDEEAALDTAILKSRIDQGVSQILVPEGDLRIELWGFTRDAQGAAFTARISSTNMSISGDASISI